MTNGETLPEKPDGANAGAPPIRKRIRIVDVTTEKVAKLLAASWRELLLSRDELSEWLGSMDRYNGVGDRPFWLKAYGGRTYNVDRKVNPEPISVDHLTVSVMGGTQPDKLASLLTNCDDDGLLARFLTVFPDPAPLKKPTAKMDEQTAVEAFQRLHRLSPAIMEDGSRRPFYLHLSEPAQDALHSFRVRCRCPEWETDATGPMKSQIGKMPGMVVRVATVLALLDWAHSQGKSKVAGIDASYINRACLYVGEHLCGHAYRAYGISSVSPDHKLARRLAHIILTEHLTQLNIRQVQQRELAGKPDAKALKAACGS